MASSLGNTTRSLTGLSPRWKRRSLFVLCAIAVLLFDVHRGFAAQAPVVVTEMPAMSQSSGAPVTLALAGGSVATSALQSPALIVKKLVTDVSEQIVAANTAFAIPHTSFVLYPTASSYATATAQYFGASAARAAADTGGFTVGRTVAIPIYKYQSRAALVNTTTHELTHAVLNSAGIGQRMPTWLNEGFAWYNGLQAEQQLDPASASLLVNELHAQLTSVLQKSQPLPSNAPVAQIIQMNQGYNVEFVDYLAVSQLIARDGVTSFRRFLHDIPLYGVDFSFTLNFHTSLSQYQASFVRSLT